MKRPMRTTKKLGRTALVAVLLMSCVLALVPSDVFANWVIQDASTAASSDGGANTSETVNVTFKNFYVGIDYENLPAWSTNSDAITLVKEYSAVSGNFQNSAKVCIDDHSNSDSCSCSYLATSYARPYTSKNVNITINDPSTDTNNKLSAVTVPLYSGSTPPTSSITSPATYTISGFFSAGDAAERNLYYVIEAKWTTAYDGGNISVWKKYWYATVSYTYTLYEYTREVDDYVANFSFDSTDSTTSSDMTLSVNTGSLISPPSKSELMFENAGYLYPVAYYKGTVGDTEPPANNEKVAFDFLTPITEETVIWVEWSEKPSDSNAKIDLNSALTAGSGTFKAYSASGAPYNLLNDVAYSSDKFYLYSSIGSGDTLSFCMNSGVYDMSAEKGEEPSKTSNYGLSNKTVALTDNQRDYTVVLQSDITISNGGTIYLGGHTASRSTSANSLSLDGYIAGNYVALDLNGHELIVEGTLHSFGYIYDSVGTGKITVKPGGILYTQFVIYGITGFDHTLKSYDMGYCPFEDYNMPYLNTTVEIISNGNGSGTLCGFATMFTSNQTMSMLGQTISVPMVNCYLNVFGASDSLFLTSAKSSSEDGLVRLTSKKMEQLSAYANDCIDIKNVFYFENLNLTFAPPILEFAVPVMGTIEMNLERTIFPISSLVDVSLSNSTMTLNQKIFVAPGSTVTFDKDSTLYLGTATHTDFDGVSVAGRTFFSAANGTVTSGGIYVMTHTVNSQISLGQKVNSQKNGVSIGPRCANFWNYFDQALVNIYGTVEFATNTTSAPYILCGNINIANFKTPNITSALSWTVANLVGKTGDTANFNNVYFSTYGSFGIPATSTTGTGQAHVAKILCYYTMPLISSGKCYFFDNSDTVDTDVIGTYDFVTGIFTAESGNTYVALCVPTIAENGLVSYSVSSESATLSADGKYVTVNGTNYIYFAGMFHSIDTSTPTDTGTSISAAPFTSAGGTVTVTWNTSTLRWTYSSYTAPS